jgi:hypothetical protein
MLTNAPIRLSLLTLTLAAVSAAPSSAIAGSGFQIIAQNRQVVTAAVVHNTATGAEQAYDQLNEAYALGPWSSFQSTSAVLGGLVALATAEQDSYLAADRLAGVGSVGFVLDDAIAPLSLQAVAQSSLATYFELAAPTLVRVEAQISDTSSSFMSLEGPGGVLAELSSGAGPALSLDLTLLLQPGYYALNIASGLDHTLLPGDAGISGQASWALQLTIVPAPGALGAFACAAGLGLRRRRR